MPSTRNRRKKTKAEPEAARPRLSLSVQYAYQPELAPARPQFRRWVGAALTPLAPFRGRGAGGEGRVSVTLRIVDEAEGRALNRDYRGKDYATNVLTFAYGADEFDPGARLSGDIILCAPVVEREAGAQGKDLIAHYAHLTVHGVLHLQGYDHAMDDEAVIMENKETGILAKLGFRDPYNEEK